jgi:hypothetical protein
LSRLVVAHDGCRPHHAAHGVARRGREPHSDQLLSLRIDGDVASSDIGHRCDDAVAPRRRGCRGRRLLTAGRLPPIPNRKHSQRQRADDDKANGDAECRSNAGGHD